jgi:hypothetical protein
MSARKRVRRDGIGGWNEKRGLGTPRGVDIGIDPDAFEMASRVESAAKTSDETSGVDSTMKDGGNDSLSSPHG